tara:strand:+ start:534 stop:1445 length:912 start_codon:yes stop_codon:yes gene_type:complete
MIQVWLIQHWQTFILTLKRLVLAPITSLLGILVMGIAFSLPVGAYMLLKNLQSLSGQIADSPQLSLYLKLNANQTAVEAVRQRLQQHERVVRFQFIPKDVALLQLQQGSEWTDMVGDLEHNPLPDAFVVNTQNASSEVLEQLQTSMQAWSEIEYVQFDSDWAKRLDALLKLGRLVVLILGTILSVALIAVMFNTIRLQILTKREEIEVTKLIGATDSFIQRPFLYFGAIQGFAGGVMAWLIIALIIQITNDELVTLTQLYTIDFHLQHLSSEDSLSLLVFSAWLGWLGARLSVVSHLWQIEPK